MSLLNPRHDQLVHGHLDAVHASGRRSRVLDVGTGTGSWAIALARRQPYADVVGVDVAWDQFEGTRLPHGNADFDTVGESPSRRSERWSPFTRPSGSGRSRSPTRPRHDADADAQT